MTKFLEDDRGLILGGLQDALAGPSPLASLIRRHVGIEDDTGRPTDAAGKLLRPSFVLFAARELGAETTDALPAAIAVELVHEFSLVHDDIQDQDQLRRDRPTLWTICGEAEAINAGDLLHAVAFREAARCGTAAVTCLAEATIEMIEGQSLDLAYEKRFVSIAEYLTMVDRKTGALLGCALELGAVVAGKGTGVRAALRALGTDLGRAFQIRDDALGVWDDAAALGKPWGSDVRRRKKAFPAVWAHERANVTDRNKLEAMYAGDSVSDVDAAWVVSLMERLGAPAAAEAAVLEHTEAALARLERLPFSSDGMWELRGLIESLAGRTR